MGARIARGQDRECVSRFGGGITYRWATVALLPAMTVVPSGVLIWKKLLIVCVEVSCRCPAPVCGTPSTGVKVGCEDGALKWPRKQLNKYEKSSSNSEY